jgi:hypothetical protein
MYKDNAIGDDILKTIQTYFLYLMIFFCNIKKNTEEPNLNRSSSKGKIWFDDTKIPIVHTQKN